MSTMTPEYSALQVADYFIFKAHEGKQGLISNLKLQKLLYYAQGLHLARFDRPLFKERVQAWTYGPVVVDAYHKYKEWEDRGIPATEDDDYSHIDENTKVFLNEIYEIFGKFSAFRLMELSHSDDCWKDAGTGNEITLESMRGDLKKYLKYINIKISEDCSDQVGDMSPERSPDDESAA